MSIHARASLLAALLGTGLFLREKAVSAATAPAGVPWVSVQIATPANGEAADAANRLANRLDGELRALGFWPDIVREAKRGRPDALAKGALAEIVVTPLPPANWRVDLRLVDRKGEPRAESQSVAAHATAVPVLAVQIVETLRSHLELPARGLPPALREASAPAPVAPVTEAAPSPKVPRGTLRLAAGIAGLVSARGGGAAWSPSLAIEGRLAGNAFALGAEVFGLGSGASVSTASGQGRVWQNVALLRMGWAFFPQARLSPSLSVGAGVLQWRGRGESNALTAESATRDGFAAAADAAVTLDVRAGTRWGLRAAVHVLASYPSYQFRLVQTADAVIGGPSLWTNVCAFFTL